MAIKLGGGSTSQINEVVSLSNTADTVTLADGRVYLRGGVLETDPSVYPSAATITGYTGTSFSTLSQDAGAIWYNLGRHSSLGSVGLLTMRYINTLRQECTQVQALV